MLRHSMFTNIQKNLISFVMNIDENMRNKKKNTRKLRVIPTKLLIS